MRAPESKLIVVPGARLLQVRAQLGHVLEESEPIAWLNTGSDLNQIFGKADVGIPYGKLIELSGRESHGKSALAAFLCACAQRDGAIAIWVDFENSWDEAWASTLGVDISKIYVITHYVGKFGKEKEMRLSTASELLAECEQLIGQLYRPGMKFFVVADSIAAMLADTEAELGLEGGFKANMALPMFLGKLMRRWVGLAQGCCATILFTNQIRENPMQMFGNPEYCPGGNAPRFFCHIRARIRKKEGGRIIRAQQVVGIQGLVSSFKNKVGGREGAEVGYKLYYEGQWKFFPAAELKKEQ
jgi:recombination protein RecA